MNHLQEMFIAWKCDELSELIKLPSDHDFAQFMDWSFNDINNNTDLDSAYMSLMSLVSFANLLGSKKSSLLSIFQKYIFKYKGSLKAMGQKLGAKEYSISAGVPGGVTIKFVWDI